MQQEKFVLPKFTVPGQRNWVKWALVGVGGLVAVNVMVFSVVLSKRTRPRSTVIAATARAGEPSLSPAAIPNPVPQPKAALAAATATAPDQAEAPARDEATAQAAKALAPAHRSHRSHASTHSRSLAKASSG